MYNNHLWIFMVQKGYGRSSCFTNITMITLWLYVKIANENGPFIVDLPIEYGDDGAWYGDVMGISLFTLWLCQNSYGKLPYIYSI